MATAPTQPSIPPYRCPACKALLPVATEVDPAGRLQSVSVPTRCPQCGAATRPADPRAQHRDDDRRQEPE